MIEEKDIRNIYEGFYKIAEIVNDNDYTLLVNQQLHHLLTTTPVPTDSESKERLNGLLGITISLEEGYYPKFEKLAKKQEDIQR
jgi:hypothetical protein